MCRFIIYISKINVISLRRWGLDQDHSTVLFEGELEEHEVDTVYHQYALLNFRLKELLRRS